MKKCNQYLSCICVCALLFTGCGQAGVPDIVDVPTIAVADDGTVTSYLVGVFDKEYYDIAGLTEMVMEETEAYNARNQSTDILPVEVEKVEALSDGSDKVVVVQKYDSPGTFSDYTGGILFYGTVAQAQEEGYDLGTELTDAGKGETLSAEQLLTEQDRYILITDQRVQLYCPRKVTHLSAGAALSEDGSVDASQTDGTVYVLMRK